MTDTFWSCVNVIVNTVPSLVLTYIPFRHKLKVEASWAFVFNALPYALYISLYIFLAPDYLSFGFLQAYKLVFIVPGICIAFAIIDVSNFKIIYFALMMITYIVVSAKLANFFVFAIYQEPSHFALAMGNICVFAVTLPLMLLYQNWLLELMNKTSEVPETDFSKTIWIMPLLFVLLCLSSNLQFNPAMVRELQFVIMDLLTAVGMLISTSVLIKILNQESENAALKENAHMTEILLTVQREQYGRIAQNIEMTKVARHDMRHQLATIGRLTDEEKVKNYIAELLGALPEASVNKYCKNHAVNAVVTHYLAAIEMEGISADVRLCIPEQVGNVSEIDLCVVMGNLLENAVEACRRMEHGKSLSAYEPM